jgi:FkbM family methyltransferase
MKKQLKEFTQRTFPSIWIKWQMLHHPVSAERELSFLDRIVRPNAVSIDVGANWGLYTRELSRLSRHVHAFEPCQQMADFLRRTSPSNVAVHEIALSDRSGEAELVVPRMGDELVSALASIEPDVASAAETFTSQLVSVRPLDSIIQDDVSFVKIDVEGHELHVLHGARDLIERSRPAFLVEAEERHRAGAARSIFKFFRDCGYRGFFIKEDEVLGVDQFDARALQDPDALLPNGGRRQGLHYINNFFFLPCGQDGREILRR